MLRNLKLKSLTTPDLRIKKSIDAFDCRFTLDADGETIRITRADGSVETLRSGAGLGLILGFELYGRKVLVVHEYGLETFQTALDPSRYRLKELARFTNKVINLGQIKYRLESLKRSRQYDNRNSFAE